MLVPHMADLNKAGRQLLRCVRLLGAGEVAVWLGTRVSVIAFVLDTDTTPSEWLPKLKAYPEAVQRREWPKKAAA